MKGYMTLNTRAMNHMHEPTPASALSRRTLTRVAVFLFGWCAGGAAYAVDFPSQPLQTGVAQPAPNVIFILDDSLSMTTQSSQNGDELDTRLVWSNTSPGMGGTSEYPGFPYSIPYTKNPLSYDPHTEYEPWATANTTDTSVERLEDASYTAVRNSDQHVVFSGTTNFSLNTQTYYVPKPSADLTDQRQYYRYQILSGGNRLVRAEWVNTAPTTTFTMTTVYSADNITGVKQYWGNNTGGTPSTSNGNAACIANTNLISYQVPAGVTRMVITTTGATGLSANPELYVRSGTNPCNTSGGYSNRSTNTGLADESITIDAPTAGFWYFGVYNSAFGTGTRTFSNVTLRVQTSTSPTQATMGCSTVASGTYGWKNCVDITLTGDTTTGVRTLDLEKQNYANWYQYHRTRMKTAKAGGSEAFATLDENYRVGLMGLYPSGSRQQVLNGSMTNIIPVDNNGGMFVGANRKAWFDHLHAMEGKQYTPLRQALDAAGKYFATERAYRSTDTSGDTTYLACRQNFAILTTDGYWNNFSGSDDPDSRYLGAAISGDEENGAVITGPNDQSYQYERAAPYWYNALGDYADTTTLADIAMHYWKTDLRTSDVSGYAGSAENRVPYSVANPAFWQHMVTFGVGLGVRGYLTNTQVAHASQGTGTLANGGYWPAPVHATGGSENPQNVDDLRHAALNSRGSYINANDSEEFANGITDALNRIGERRGSASNVLANSTSISTESFVYQATYTAGSWRGDLLAYPISSAGLGAPEWRAGEHIAAPGSRNIFTMGATGGSTFPSATQLAALATEATTLGLASGTALVDYLKGDGSLEERNGGVLRNRVMRNAADQIIPALLGDIVDSSPFYVADNQTVFVGANDGMLHAIDGSNTAANVANTSGGGTERFTYIPRGVAMDQLAELADPAYGTTSTKPHRFFVDGPIVVSSRARTPGRNYLIGALGRGGRGVYGLNVTNPGTFGASNVLWDNTGALAPANMGNVISEPLISKLNTGVTAAVVANGPNSDTGTASLFIINLDTGATIHEFDTGTTDNALSAPRAVDVNADGMVDFFFAGDLQGSLWRFDVNATSTSGWSRDKVFTTSTGQPISSAPGVARDPATGKIWVFFGTGRYMTADDQASVVTQTYYGLIVGADGTEGVNLTRTDLEQRSIHVVDEDTGRRAFEPSDSAVVENGWYIDFNDPPGTGERVISAPLIFGDILIFSSIVPPSASTINSCSAGGSGYINALAAFSGKSLDVPFFTDLDITMVTDENGDELPIGSLPLDAGMPTAPIIIGNQLVVGDSSGGTPTSVEVSGPAGSATRRVSWRELLNDQ
jgi:type IV pilus assembly protein PilY1